MQDGSSILSNSNENLNTSFDGKGTSIDDDESSDPWQFRPKAGCRYLRVGLSRARDLIDQYKRVFVFICQPIDQDQQQRTPARHSAFSSFYYMACSERGQIGKRRVRLGRGGRYKSVTIDRLLQTTFFFSRLLYDRHTEQENKDLTDETSLSSHIADKYVFIPT